MINLWDPPEGWNKYRYKVPDYRIYKIKGIWELEYAEKILAQKGLKDPWLRNHAWRYPPWWTKPSTQVGKYFKAGCLTGFFCCVGIISMEEIYYRYYGKPDYVHHFIDQVFPKEPNRSTICG